MALLESHLMRHLMFAFIVFTQLLLVGCAGVGIVSTSDPQAKLNDAVELYRKQNRPLPAERLIFEAIDIYQQQNDSKGLGLAYLLYGDLLLSDSVSTREDFYKKNGFKDKSVTFENRVAKSKDYATEARKYFLKAVEQTKETGKHAELASLYFNIGLTYNMQSDRENACRSYDKSFVALSEDMRSAQSDKQHVPSTDGWSAEIAAEKKRLKCE
jgi:tetratricopeptide (TPR) repeat protein